MEEKDNRKQIEQMMFFLLGVVLSTILYLIIIEPTLMMIIYGIFITGLIYLVMASTERIKRPGKAVWIAYVLQTIVTAILALAEDETIFLGIVAAEAIIAVLYIILKAVTHNKIDPWKVEYELTKLRLKEMQEEAKKNKEGKE